MTSAAGLQRELRRLRSTFGAAAEAGKERLLAALAAKELRTPALLSAYHEDLLFLVAFPGSVQVRAGAIEQLGGIARRIASLGAAGQAAFRGTGIAGSVTRYAIAHPIAALVCGDDPAAIELDWSSVEDPARLDELIARVLNDVERESFAVDMPTRRWVTLARRRDAASTLQWLLKAGDALPAAERARFAAAWDQAEVPVRWRLNASPRSVTLNRIDVRSPVLRSAFRRLAAPLARHAMTPLDAIERLPRRRAGRFIDVARSALAARCREVHAMNQANPDEVYLADFGEGVQLAVIGVLPAQRLLLEANYGYVLLSNGVPIGYGGVSPLFRQANTGINVFDPFRGSEATFLWAQTLRAFRSLFGVRRFIVNGYQFGAGNAEAIASGAFWFYYRLGFRPASTEHRRLADAEAARLQGEGGRSPAATLRQLARGDLVLDLPDWDDADAFDEASLDRLGTVVARQLSGQPHWSRRRGARALAAEVAHACGLQLHRRAAAERSAFERLAPLVAALPGWTSWLRAERGALGAMLLSKGALQEATYARGAVAHPRFFRELAAVLAAPVPREGAR
ncbi:MAG: hypothetical protein ACM3O5_01060 [Betaproteobacteria bacterium]